MQSYWITASYFLRLCSGFCSIFHVQFCHSFHHVFLGNPKEQITITFRIRFKFISQAQGEESAERRGGQGRGTGRRENGKGKS